MEYILSYSEMLSVDSCDLMSRYFVAVQVGDGTTTVVLLAGEFLKEAKPYIEDGVHPQNFIRSYRTASTLVRCQLNFLYVNLD